MKIHYLFLRKCKNRYWFSKIKTPCQELAVLWNKTSPLALGVWEMVLTCFMYSREEDLFQGLTLFIRLWRCAGWSLWSFCLYLLRLGLQFSTVELKKCLAELILSVLSDYVVIQQSLSSTPFIKSLCSCSCRKDFWTTLIQKSLRDVSK